MIIARAPMRISFVGGGTDLPAFYSRFTGRVLSATIDKYVYVVANQTPLIDKVTARYNISETVDHPRELQHTRIRAALQDFGIEKNIEIGSFASLPAKTGLGSSSSFSCALLKGLTAFGGKKISKQDLAEAACRLEIDTLKEPIGKQDQYAASFGGMNIIEFRPDGVAVEPVLLDFRKRAELERHLLLLFTGTTRLASSVLTEQSSRVDEKFAVYRKMSDSVMRFKDKLCAGDMEGVGRMLHEGWELKKSLASNISNHWIDDMYTAGIAGGAWGGKILGAGGGGCFLFAAPPERHDDIERAVFAAAVRNKLEGFRKIPFKFTQSGTDLLFNNLHPHLPISEI